MKKGKFAKRTIAFLILQVFLFCFNVFAGQMIKPRIIYQIKSKYFDILYSKESTYTAKLLADNVDSLYEKAAELLHADKIMGTPIVISPDSDVLKVNYTSYPYNRIVIMEGLPDSVDTTYDTELLTLLYSQILKATAASIKSPFNKVIANFTSWWQPVEVLNLPFSALDGVSYLDQILTGSGEYNDGYFLQVLSQAKVEGNFPSWLQAGAASNAYTSNHLAVAANSAFAAYLISAYGIEKYTEFLHECGKIYFPRVTKTIFKKVYGRNLDEEWKIFEEMVPVPENIVPDIDFCGQSVVRKLFSNSDGTYKFLLNTPYGLVYFDSIKNEIVLAKEIQNPFLHRKELFKMHLFFAKGITKFDLSPDGRYLLVCCNESRYRNEFIEPCVRFFDLQTHFKLLGKFILRDAAFVFYDDGSGSGKPVLGVAGINSSKKNASLEVYPFNERKRLRHTEKSVYSYDFEPGVTLQNVTYAGINHVACLVQKNGEITLCTTDFTKSAAESEWNEYTLHDGDNALSIREMRYLAGDFMFQYVSPEEHSFTRFGKITLDSDFNPQSVELQKNDVLGGVYTPFVKNDEVYFARRFSNHDELAVTSINNFDFAHGSVVKKEKASEKSEEKNVLSVEELKSTYPHARYYPLKYLENGTNYPFFPIVSFDYNRDFVLWPGLGISNVTSSDPFDNTTIASSVSFGFSQYKIEELGENFVEEVDRMIENFKQFENDLSFVFLVKNTSTPLDLTLGSLFTFSNSGTYIWRSIAGAKFRLPFVLNMNALDFNLKFQYIVSSNYVGFADSDDHPDLQNWPSLSDAYQFSEVYSNITYSNIHPYGNSLFEKFGFSVGLTSIADFDSFENSSSYSHFKKVAKFTVGFDVAADLPRLLPVEYYNGMIFCLPTELYCESFVTDGTAFKAGGEVLLFGKEVKNGIYPVFVSRTGLKAGYSWSLKYDTESEELPDIRDFSNYLDTFARSEKVDDIYIKYVLDIVPVIGSLSKENFRGEIKFSFLPRTNDFRVGVGIYVNLY